MPDNKTVIIIGAGIGGIATAVYLAKSGFRVSLYEKNGAPGGRCGQLKREGHRFDLGATMLLMPGIYQQIFNSLGIKLEEDRDIVPLNNLYRIFFDDGSNLEFTSDMRKMQVQLENIEPGSYERSVDYISRGMEIFNESMGKLIDRNFYNVFQMINLKNIPLLFRIKAFTPHYRYTMRFFRHPHLLMSFTFQNIYVGQSPFDSPALFSMVPAAELTEGSFFPSHNGMFSVVEKLTQEAEKAGVIFHYNYPVKKIIIEKGLASGIILPDGTAVSADIIIANADLPYVYRSLLPDKKASSRLDKLRYSCSSVCFHWGLDKKFPRLDHHNVFLSDSFKKGLDRIFNDKVVSENPSFYVHAPSRTDPEAAPPNQDTLSVIVATGHIDQNYRQNWDRIRDTAREAVIKRLKKAGIEDIEAHIKFEVCFTPESWESACNISRGSVFGSLSHNIFQMGYFRPHNRHKKYKNLYFVGGSTHPGNGIPNVLISAKLTSERILKDACAVLSNN